MFTALSVYRGSAFYCDGWWGKRGERWPLPPRHLAMNSEQLDRQWGNYTIIITRTCAQAYLFAHYINTVLYTRWGPQCLQPDDSLPPLLCTSLLYYLFFSVSLSMPTREFQPSRKACQLWTTECVCEYLCMCVWESKRKREAPSVCIVCAHMRSSSGHANPHY